MRIALDATAIPQHRTGAGNYIFNLIAALARVDRHNQYVVFAKPEHIRELAIDQPNMRLIPFSTRFRPLRLLWEQIGLPLRLRALRIDVLHSPHYTRPLIVPCASVVTFCDMTFFLLPELHSRIKRVFFRAMMRWSARFADRLAAISESTRRDVITRLRPAVDVITTPLAAGPMFRPLPPGEVATVCAHYDLTPGTYLCYVGVLEPRKNIPALIEAYARIAAEFPDLPLVIAGKKGWMFDEIFARVAELGLTDRVRFLGHVPDSHLAPLYNGARAVVYPSSYEGFGLPVLEAMQCGAAVITSNVSSMPEVIGDAGLLIDPRSVDELAATIRRVAADDTLATDLGRRARERAALFSWERCAHETIRAYEAAYQARYRHRALREEGNQP